MCLFQATFVLVTIFTPLKFCLVFTYASIDVVFTKLQRKVYGIVTEIQAMFVMVSFVPGG